MPLQAIQMLFVGIDAPVGTSNLGSGDLSLLLKSSLCCSRILEGELYDSQLGTVVSRREAQGSAYPIVPGAG